MKILAIESSCDESAVALFDSNVGVLEDLIYSQVDLHALYGGVVPDLASSAHLEKLPSLIEKILPHARDVDFIAATCAPGLPNCLAVGVAAASGLAFALNKPLFGVNHLRAHAYSPFIKIHRDSPALFEKNFAKHLPHLGLVASGGNAFLFELDENKSLKILAETVDDAAGEALDKGAKLLGMPYPGGALLEKIARDGKVDKTMFPYGQNRKIEDDPDFSFSGLKTSLRYRLEKMSANEIRANLADICASYQFAVVEQLKRRTDFFLSRKTYKSLGLSGGVANNSYLAETFNTLSEKRCKRELLIAEKSQRGDNAAMIAFAAFASPEALYNSQNLSLKISPSAPLE